MQKLCDCAEDGYCPRYQREMRGRFHEICRGVDVDAGTAAAFREQWAREAGPAVPSGSPVPLLLRTDQMPGDAVVMTAAIYSLHKAHPSKYLTAVESQWPEVFEYNPDVANSPKGGCNFDIARATSIQMHYPAIHQCNERGIHFMQGWCEHLERVLGVPVPLLTNRPRLYFPTTQPLREKYWIVCSGGKDDFTNKLWGGYQEVVHSLRGVVKFVQVGTDTARQPPLEGAKYMVGKTSLRNLFWWVRAASGVLCGVSLLMHVAAACEVPAVVVAGGREPVQWNTYPKQQYVHTVGALPCRSVQGYVGQACWRSRVVPLGDGSWHDRDTCERPVGGLPQCMAMISPVHVADLIMRYNNA